MGHSAGTMRWAAGLERGRDARDEERREGEEEGEEEDARVRIIFEAALTFRLRKVQPEGRKTVCSPHEDCE